MSFCLSKPNFAEWVSVFEKDQRSHFGPYFGWLDAWLNPYPDTMNLKTMVRLRDHGLRSLIELEPTGHPLAIEQRDGIDESRVQYLFELMMHDATPPSAPDS